MRFPVKKFVSLKQILLKDYPESYTDKTKVLGWLLFLNLVFFLGLSETNPFKFFLPHVLYPGGFVSSLFRKTGEKDVRYYTYSKEEREMLQLRTGLQLSGLLANDLIFLAQIVQQPKFYLRGRIAETRETFYFPNFSAGILFTERKENTLYVVFNLRYVREYPYQRELREEEWNDQYDLFLNAFWKTIFENYGNLNTIIWIDEFSQKVVRRNDVINAFLQNKGK